MSNQDDGFVQMEIDLGLDDGALGDGWDGSYSKVDPGGYLVEVENATTSTAASSGNSQLELTLRVLSDGPMQGRTQKAWYSLVHNDGCRRRLKNLLEALQHPLGKFTPASLMGRQMQIEVYLDEYPLGSGKFNNKVKGEKALAAAPTGVRPPSRPAQQAQPQQQMQAPPAQDQQAAPQQPQGQQAAPARPTRPPPRAVAPQNGQPPQQRK